MPKWQRRNLSGLSGFQVQRQGALCAGLRVSIQYGNAHYPPVAGLDLPHSRCRQLPHPSLQETSSDSTRPIWAPGAHTHPSLPGLRSCRGRHLGWTGSSRDVVVSSSGHEPAPLPPGVRSRPLSPEGKPSASAQPGRTEAGKWGDCTCAGKSPGYPLLECRAVSRNIQNYISMKIPRPLAGFVYTGGSPRGREADGKGGVINEMLSTVSIALWRPNSTEVPEVMG